MKTIKKIDIQFTLLNDDENFERIDLSKINECDVLEQKAIILIAIRNKFAHNQMPDKVFYQIANNIISKDEKESYSNYFYKVVQFIIKDLITD